MTADGKNDEPLMKPEEVADYLGYAKNTIYNKVQNGEIPHKRVGGVLRFRRSEIDAWIERQNSERAS